MLRFEACGPVGQAGCFKEQQIEAELEIIRVAKGQLCKRRGWEAMT